MIYTIIIWYHNYIARGIVERAIGAEQWRWEWRWCLERSRKFFYSAVGTTWYLRTQVTLCETRYIMTFRMLALMPLTYNVIRQKLSPTKCWTTTRNGIAWPNSTAALKWFVKTKINKQTRLISNWGNEARKREDLETSFNQFACLIPEPRSVLINAQNMCCPFFGHVLGMCWSMYWACVGMCVGPILHTRAQHKHVCKQTHTWPAQTLHYHHKKTYKSTQQKPSSFVALNSGTDHTNATTARKLIDRQFKVDACACVGGHVAKRCTHRDRYTHTHRDRHAPTNTYKYIYTHIYTYIYTYMHAYIHIYIHTYIHTYVHTYIHTYIHTYPYTYVHTHIHTYMHCIHTQHYIPYIHADMHVFASIEHMRQMHSQKPLTRHRKPRTLESLKDMR